MAGLKTQNISFTLLSQSEVEKPRIDTWTLQQCLSRLVNRLSRKADFLVKSMKVNPAGHVNKRQVLEDPLLSLSAAGYVNLWDTSMLCSCVNRDTEEIDSKGFDSSREHQKRERFQKTGVLYSSSGRLTSHSLNDSCYLSNTNKQRGTKRITAS